MKESNSSLFFKTTIKKSKKRNMWQIKGPEHDLYSIDGLKSIIESIIISYGFDKDDLSKIYLLTYGDAELYNYQVKIRKESVGSDFVNYITIENKINTIEEKIWLPKILLKA